MDKYDVLKQYFGHSDFREGQPELIDNILSGKDVLGIMPTGAGKSLCFQTPAMLFKGVTLVISPLISLMKDQVNALTQSGIKAAYINSSLSAAQYRKVLENSENGAYKIIYVAPERLESEDMYILAERIHIDMITVDEAHCVSQWGQDFRPSYLRIPEFVGKLSYRPIISAFTATATEKVRLDVMNILHLQAPFTITTGFNRENLYFEVQKPKKKLAALLDFLKQNTDKSGIIYCATRKTVEMVCEALQQQHYSATRYHAGLSDHERHENQDDFLYDKKTIMVATNAFGMGIDKSNVSYVVHYNMPKNLESYYQEAGRAGRDGEPASCVLLYSPQDVRTNQYLIEYGLENNSEYGSQTRASLREKDLELLKLITFYSTTTNCLRGYILKYFGETPPHFCGNCSNCLTNFESVDISIDAQKVVSCVYRIEQQRRSFGKVMIVDILRGSKNKKLMKTGMDKLSTYGIMASSDAHRVRNIIDYLIENEYLELTTDEHPVVKISPRSMEIIREKKQILIKLPKEVVVDKPVKGDKSRSAKSSGQVHEVDDHLFTKLKTLRSTLAAKARVPAYIIFSDASLRDMCAKLPLNRNDFLKVSGVGDAKMEKYGEDFIEVIKKHTNKL